LRLISTSYSNTGLSGGKRYYYRVRATNSGSNSAYSNIANATTPTAFASAKDTKDQNGVANNFTAWPNPVTSHTTLSFTVDRDQKVQLLVYDLEGKVVDQVYSGNAEAGKKYQFNWNAFSRASRSYIATLKTEKGVFTQKILSVR
jgi:hypothetical protein